jgi:formate-dependent nitrite reductase cytochrome c552 subunit
MGVTLPNDYCYRCHHDIAEDRPSHKDLGFESCATAGCHNYHDNAALYEDFLVKHAGEPATLQSFVLPRRNFSERWKEQKQGKLIALTRGDVDAPAHATVSPDVVEEWVTTAHAKAGVNCSDCHTSKGPAGTRSAWIENPTFKQCTSCHDVEVDGFLAGKHGMRLAQNLAPMRPESARLPMQDDAHGKQLGCASCHNDHRFDVQQAAVDSCLGCHADDHSLAYKNSPHYKLWRETSGKTMDADTGVSCSTCHLPREVHGKADPKTIVVQHNQNLNLRPNEKMIRGVCMQCHGLGFSIDALAD